MSSLRSPHAALALLLALAPPSFAAPPCEHHVATERELAQDLALAALGNFELAGKAIEYLRTLPSHEVATLLRAALENDRLAVAEGRRRIQLAVGAGTVGIFLVAVGTLLHLSIESGPSDGAAYHHSVVGMTDAAGLGLLGFAAHQVFTGRRQLAQIKIVRQLAIHQLIREMGIERVMTRGLFEELLFVSRWRLIGGGNSAVRQSARALIDETIQTQIKDASEFLFDPFGWRQAFREGTLPDMDHDIISTAYEAGMMRYYFAGDTQAIRALYSLYGEEILYALELRPRPEDGDVVLDRLAEIDEFELTEGPQTGPTTPRYAFPGYAW